LSSRCKIKISHDANETDGRAIHIHVSASDVHPGSEHIGRGELASARGMAGDPNDLDGRFVVDARKGKSDGVKTVRVSVIEETRRKNFHSVRNLRGPDAPEIVIAGRKRNPFFGNDERITKNRPVDLSMNRVARRFQPRRGRRIRAHRISGNAEIVRTPLARKLSPGRKNPRSVVKERVGEAASD